MQDIRLILGDCLDVLPTLPSASVDVVLTDPPYPCIKRSYGTWTEAEWFALMRAVVPECMRILKPTGSAVFILQPNSERVGRMRTWLWEFMVWVGKEWGIVQDHWWWNTAALPGHYAGLNRPSLKACVWFGPSDCHRNQDAVLWSESERNRVVRAMTRFDRTDERPSGRTVNHKRMCGRAVEKGGVTPFNVLPIPNTNSATSAGGNGHGAGTPAKLCSWWLRYLCPPGGTVLDCFGGTGTVALEALKQDKHAISIERIPEYHAIAEKRIAEAKNAHPLFAGDLSAPLPPP